MCKEGALTLRAELHKTTPSPHFFYRNTYREAHAKSYSEPPSLWCTLFPTLPLLPSELILSHNESEIKLFCPGNTSYIQDRRSIRLPECVDTQRTSLALSTRYCVTTIFMFRVHYYFYYYYYLYVGTCNYIPETVFVGYKILQLFCG